MEVDSKLIKVISYNDIYIYLYDYYVKIGEENYFLELSYEGIDILITETNKLLILTNKYIVIYELNTEKVYNVYSPNEDDMIAFNYLYDDELNILYSTANGVYLWRPSKDLLDIGIDSTITKIFVDENNILLVSSNVIYAYDSSTSTFIPYVLERAFTDFEYINGNLHASYGRNIYLLDETFKIISDILFYTDFLKLGSFNNKLVLIGNNTLYIFDIFFNTVESEKEFQDAIVSITQDQNNIIVVHTNYIELYEPVSSVQNISPKLHQRKYSDFEDAMNYLNNGDLNNEIYSYSPVVPSSFEYEIASKLINRLKIPVLAEVPIPVVRNNKRDYHSFDLMFKHNGNFYIVETDGPQHFKGTNYIKDSEYMCEALSRNFKVIRLQSSEYFEVMIDMLDMPNTNVFFFGKSYDKHVQHLLGSCDINLEVVHYD